MHPIWMCAQPANLYFAWQTEVLLVSLLKHGVPGDRIQIVCAYQGRPSEEWVRLRRRFRDVSFFFYPDMRSDRWYRPSVRPHVLSQHFQQYPDLRDERIFYHDCDVILTSPLDFAGLLEGDVWWVSNAYSYISSEYVLSKGRAVYDGMCRAIGIDPAIPIANDEHSGGAQYLMRGLDARFWYRVEIDCHRLHRFLRRYNRANPHTETYHPLQIWTADMWALLWNAWREGREVRIHERLAFQWPHDWLSHSGDHPLFHNAGVTEHDEGMFFKGAYLDRLPYSDTPDLDESRATVRYWNAVQEAGVDSCLV